MEKNMEFQQFLYLRFIQYSKAFDQFQREKIWTVKTEMIPSQHIWWIWFRFLATGQEVTVKKNAWRQQLVRKEYARDASCHHTFWYTIWSPD